MCKNDDEEERQYAEAADDRRPFVAMVEGDGESGRRVVYAMESTGEGADDGYALSDDAVDELDDYREQVERDDDRELSAGTCTRMEGSFDGLTIDGAQDVATRVADVVWNTDNWEDRTA